MSLFRVLDFETTGEPSEENPAGIIEYGFTDVVVDDEGARLGGDDRAFVACRLPVSVEARAVHHITDEEIASGIPVEHALLRIMGNAGGIKPDYFVAHHADFERQFFAGGETPWICTYKVALRAWPDAPRHTNQVLRYWRNLPVDFDRSMPPHRALPDSYVTAALFMDLYQDLVVARGRQLADLVAISNMPPMPHHISFGKHKGQKWSELPHDYLHWIFTKSDMDKDTKWLARQHFEGRVR